MLVTHLTPHTSHLTPHTPHLTPHTLHLTPHTSHLTPHCSECSSRVLLINHAQSCNRSSFGSLQYAFPVQLTLQQRHIISRPLLTCNSIVTGKPCIPTKTKQLKQKQNKTKQKNLVHFTARQSSPCQSLLSPPPPPTGPNFVITLRNTALYLISSCPQRLLPLAPSQVFG